MNEVDGSKDKLFRSTYKIFVPKHAGILLINVDKTTFTSYPLLGFHAEKRESYFNHILQYIVSACVLFIKSCAVNNLLSTGGWG